MLGFNSGHAVEIAAAESMPWFLLVDLVGLDIVSRHPCIIVVVIASLATFGHSGCLLLGGDNEASVSEATCQDKEERCQSSVKTEESIHGYSHNV